MLRRFSQQDGTAQGNGGLAHKAEPGLPAYRERPLETPERHVVFRLDEQKPASLCQKGEELTEEAGFVRTPRGPSRRQGRNRPVPRRPDSPFGSGAG